MSRCGTLTRTSPTRTTHTVTELHLLAPRHAKPIVQRG
jgi:hypothetical protein